MSAHAPSRLPDTAALRTVAAMAAAVLAVVACSDTLTVPAGTTLVATLDEGVDPGDVAVGDVLTARLAGDLTAGEQVYLPAGAVIRGRVTAVQEARGPWPLVVKLAFDSVAARGAERPVQAKIAAVESEPAEDGGGTALQGDLVGSVLEGPAAGPMVQDEVAQAAGSAVVLGTEAETVLIPPGARLELQLTAPLEVPAP